MTKLDQYILELEIELDTTATRIRLEHQFCQFCGMRLVEGECQSPGCRPVPDFSLDDVEEIAY